MTNSTITKDKTATGRIIYLIEYWVKNPAVTGGWSFGRAQVDSHEAAVKYLSSIGAK